MITPYNIRITTTTPIIIHVAHHQNPSEEALRIVPTSLKSAIRHNFRFMFGENTALEGTLFGSTGRKSSFLIKDNFRFEGKPDIRVFTRIDNATGGAKMDEIYEARLIPPGTTIIGTIYVNEDANPKHNFAANTLIQFLRYSELIFGAMQSFGYGTATCELIDLKDAGLIFVSYTHENDAHANWVLQIADRLSRLAFNLVFDQFDLRYGANIHFFMEQAVEKSEKILLILTPEYKRRASTRIGGAGYEFSMMLSQLLENLSDNSKIIPVLRKGSVQESVPLMLRPYFYCDVRDDNLYEENISALVSAVLGKPKHQRPQHDKY